MYTAFRYTFRARLAFYFRFCFCPYSHKSPARHHLKVTFRRIVAACLGGCSLSEDSNENRGATYCQLLMLIGSDLWGKNMASVQNSFRGGSCRGGSSQNNLLERKDSGINTGSQSTGWKSWLPESTKQVRSDYYQSCWTRKLKLCVSRAPGGRHWQFKALQSARKQKSSVEMHPQAPDY